MIQILELLDNQYHEYSEGEKLELKKKLQEINFIAANFRAMHGENVETDKLKVTDEDVMKEIRLRNSLPLKLIILSCEGLLDKYKEFFTRETPGNSLKHDKKYYANPHRNPSYRGLWGFRFEVSLVEVIAGKLFPKGRSWRNYVVCKQFEGYEEAYKKAKSLEASYSRAMSNLLKKGLVEKFHDGHNMKEMRYIITDYGRYV
jgi:hypothetical protein